MYNHMQLLELLSLKRLMNERNNNDSSSNHNNNNERKKDSVREPSQSNIQTNRKGSLGSNNNNHKAYESQDSARDIQAQPAFPRKKNIPTKSHSMNSQTKEKDVNIILQYFVFHGYYRLYFFGILGTHGRVATPLLRATGGRELIVA